MRESENKGYAGGDRWQRTAAMIFVVAAALVGIYLALRYAVGILLPFLIAWAVGAAVHPIALRVSRRAHLPQRLCAAVLMLLLLSLVTALLIAAADTLLSEVRHLLARLETDGGELGTRLSAWFGRMREWTEQIPWLNRLRRVDGLAPLVERMDELVSDLIRETLGELSQRIPQWIGRLLRAVPSLVIFTVVMLIAGFYFSADLKTIHRALRGLLPMGVAKRLPAWKARLGQVLRQYARAYLLLLLITFLELYVALSILGVDYAFLIAALTALVDILPIFGVGIVLIPWAAVLLIGRQFYVGFGLLITYAAVTVIRQILEPRVVSGSLGLHPLLTLFCMYVGYRLLGILGMMLAPAAAILVSGLGARDQLSSSEEGA